MFQIHIYYHDVEIMSERFMMLPQRREDMPGLKIIERPNVFQNNSKSLNPEEIPLDLTCSGLLRPLEPTNTEKSVKDLLILLLGNEKAANVASQAKKIAQGDWDWINAKPVKELNTPGFFALAFPTIFISDSCDFTTPKVSKSVFEFWIEHIYFNKDNRISSHQYLKTFLLNLQLRTQALNLGSFVVSQQLNLQLRTQALNLGSFVVSQQLNDAHLTIPELRQNLENNDDSVPRKIISMD